MQQARSRPRPRPRPCAGKHYTLKVCGSVGNEYFDVHIVGVGQPGDLVLQNCRVAQTLSFNTPATAGDLSTQIVDVNCMFDNNLYDLYFTISCAAASAVDCPNIPTTTGHVSFTITSENFCSLNADDASTINGVITLDQFFAVKTADGLLAAAQNAFRYGDTIYYVIQFHGVPVHDFQLKSVRGYYADGAAPSSPVNWGSQSGTFLIGSSTPMSEFTVSGGGLGLLTTTSGQEFRFSHAINADLLNNDSTGPLRGETKYLQLQAIVNVDYRNLSGRRRRRQAAATSGSGVIGSQPAAIAPAEEAAVSPANSAVRAAPAVAFVLALLSAVALL